MPSYHAERLKVSQAFLQQQMRAHTKKFFEAMQRELSL